MTAAELGTVLVTGAGGPAAVTVLQSLRGHADLVAADIDPMAAGLYLVGPDRRVLLPRGDEPSFVDTLLGVAVRFGADLVIPTVDAELRGVAAAADRFGAHGIDLLVETVPTLDLCLDKYALVEECVGRVRVPATVVLDADTGPGELASLGRPFIVKPRSGNGGGGFAVVADAGDLAGIPRDGSRIAQEFLPGAEYSIDVLARPGGGIVAAVPRRRDKVDSGIAVAGRTVRDLVLQRFGRRVAESVGARGVINVQVKLTSEGEPALLEVNPRFPGTMSLTRAAGIDMPLLAARAARGHPLPAHIEFTEVAVVRHWADVAVPIEEYADIAGPAELTSMPAGPG